MIRNLPIAVLLIVGFLISGLIPLLIVSLVSYNTTRDEMKGQVFRQLESVRNIKKEQLYTYYKERFADISVFALDPTVILAFDELEAAFKSEGGGAGGGFSGLSHENYEAPASYVAVHDRYFSFFKNLIAHHRYYDLFLLDPVDGETIFTVRKEADFGDRISELSSSLRDVWITAVKERRICLSDTRPYPPSDNIPAQFLAAPIFSGDEVRGVIAFQISSEAVDDIMKERSGMWRTGETYLVGQDKKMRSDSYLDSLDHSVQASFSGTVEDNGVDTVASREALNGTEGRKIITDYRDRRVLSAFAPVYINDVRWALIAEVDEEEIDGQIAAALNLRLFTLTGFSVLLLLVLALSISALINKDIRSVIKQQERMIGDILRGRLETRAEPGSVGVDFRRVAARTNELLDAFVKQIEERRKLEEHIQRTQRLEAIGTLAGGIAHDLNNILTSMHAYAEIIRTNLPENSFAEENLNHLVTTVRRASELVEQILTFSRRAKTEEKYFNISDEIRESVKLFKATLPPNISVDGDSVPESLPIKANPSEIRQVIMNLCTNAIQAMGKTGGKLTITAGKAGQAEIGEVIPGGGDYCKISVRDTGHGMDEGVRERIFEPFFTTKPAGEGTGMGLSVVHGIVGKYGGAIEVESSPGAGSRFDVYLPLAREAEVRKGIEEPDPGLIRGEGRILFVDDDKHICDSQKKSLELLGYNVTAIQDSREAEMAFARAPDEFDLLILDLSMPNLNGYELAERIVGIRPDVPIILTTGYAELADARRIEQSGFKSFILKPYRLNEISRLIAGIMKSVRGI